MRLSHIIALRCPVVLLFNLISVVFRSIGLMSSLELPNIFPGVLIYTMKAGDNVGDFMGGIIVASWSSIIL